MSQSERPESDHGSDIRATTPEEFTALRLTAPAHVVAGLPAVAVTLRYAWGEMGVVRGLRASLTMNQKGGFDCMSCALSRPPRLSRRMITIKR